MKGQTAEEAGRVYLARGWAAIPVERGGKRPLIRWEEFQHRLPSKQELHAWFERWPHANICIVTGLVSRLVVLDIDPRHDGDATLTRLEREHGPLPHSVEALTGGGGRHIYFLHPGDVIRNKVGLATGIDLRGDGGLVVAPPSVHPSGRSYTWEVSRHPDETPLATMPLWLQSLASDDEVHPGHPMAHWRSLVRSGVPEGERNNTIASLTGHLLWHGVDPQVALELLLCWNRMRCRPPLADDEVARTVESIRRTHFRERGGKPLPGSLGATLRT
ncbi:MAG: bifunctional DNA primase/polymerase [Alphaproteobacteria bacterium]